MRTNCGRNSPASSVGAKRSATSKAFSTTGVFVRIATVSTVAIATLAITKLLLGWPLVVLGLLTMIWMLSRDRTPVEEEPAG